MLKIVGLLVSTEIVWVEVDASEGSPMVFVAASAGICGIRVPGVVQVAATVNDEAVTRVNDAKVQVAVPELLKSPTTNPCPAGFVVTATGYVTSKSSVPEVTKSTAELPRSESGCNAIVAGAILLAKNSENPYRAGSQAG